MVKQEYEGIAFTSGIRLDGWQVSVTSRADSPSKAVDALEVEIINMIGRGFVPFVSYYNRAEVDTVPQQVELGPESTAPVTEEDFAEAMTSVAEELGGVQVPEGHVYLGVKSGKLDEIRENDSYQALAETYSYDGTWVNFYNGSSEMSVAGSYYANQTGAKIFNEMFHWEPALVEKAPIPGGDVMLYILGVKGKKGPDIYQNIKGVEPA